MVIPLKYRISILASIFNICQTWDFFYVIVLWKHKKPMFYSNAMALFSLPSLFRLCSIWLIDWTITMTTSLLSIYIDQWPWLLNQFCPCWCFDQFEWITNVGSQSITMFSLFNHSSFNQNYWNDFWMSMATSIFDQWHNVCFFYWIILVNVRSMLLTSKWKEIVFPHLLIVKLM